MGKLKDHLKKQNCKSHREYVYQKTIGRVLSGELPPEYMATRWKKLKEVRK